MIVQAQDSRFPKVVKQIDTTTCSVTYGEYITVNYPQAIEQGIKHSEGPIRVIGAISPDNSESFKMFVGLSSDSRVWIMDIRHGMCWTDPIKGLCYHMEYQWCPVQAVSTEVKEALGL